jgi:hypothetical protein
MYIIRRCMGNAAISTYNTGGFFLFILERGRTVLFSRLSFMHRASPDKRATNSTIKRRKGENRFWLV